MQYNIKHCEKSKKRKKKKREKKENEKAFINGACLDDGFQYVSMWTAAAGTVNQGLGNTGGVCNTAAGGK